jgi:hypothetical protein
VGSIDQGIPSRWLLKFSLVVLNMLRVPQQ